MQRGCKRYTGCLSRCSLSPFSKAMPLPDTMFCAQQIDIAQELPDILKNFTKAAVRTQPEDLLLWSAAYFTALSKGERLPVKDRLELNVTHKTDSAMTPGLLKTLHKQIPQPDLSYPSGRRAARRNCGRSGGVCVYPRISWRPCCRWAVLAQTSIGWSFLPWAAVLWERRS
ncbi:ropporin-1-like protein isoform X4 [Gasterosteus aculeatus]